jgi:hypothetical protein
MRKFFYISAFGFLGLVVATVLHALIEIPALKIIFDNPERFANTIWWQQWYAIHWSISILLWVVGLVVGVRLGVRYWPQLGNKTWSFGVRKLHK